VLIPSGELRFGPAAGRWVIAASVLGSRSRRSMPRRLVSRCRRSVANFTSVAASLVRRTCPPSPGSGSGGRVRSVIGPPGDPSRSLLNAGCSRSTAVVPSARPSCASSGASGSPRGEHGLDAQVHEEQQLVAGEQGAHRVDDGGVVTGRDRIRIPGDRRDERLDVPALRGELSPPDLHATSQTSGLPHRCRATHLARRPLLTTFKCAFAPDGVARDKIYRTICDVAERGWSGHSAGVRGTPSSSGSATIATAAGCRSSAPASPRCFHFSPSTDTHLPHSPDARARPHKTAGGRGKKKS
jgi:hypothetical protein